MLLWLMIYHTAGKKVNWSNGRIKKTIAGRNEHNQVQLALLYVVEPASFDDFVFKPLPTLSIRILPRYFRFHLPRRNIGFLARFVIYIRPFRLLHTLLAR